MPAQPLDVHVVTQHLEGEVQLAEPLLFPAIVLCQEEEAKVQGTLRELTRMSAENLPPTDWHRYVLPEAPTIGRIQLLVDPPPKQHAWLSPLPSVFEYVAWKHGNEAVIAYVPALQIEVIARSQKELDEIAPEHLRSALRRSAAAASLYRIALLRRVEKIELRSFEIVADIKSPRQRQIDEGKESDGQAKPLIEKVGRVLSAEPDEAAYERAELVARLADALAGRNPQSILLVGPSGAGKTAVVRELIRQRHALRLAETPFWGTSGARLVAGMSGFGMWQERCAQLCREAAAQKAIVHLGNLAELMEVGKSENATQGIGSFLRPYLLRGDLLAIAECTPEQFSSAEQRDPHLLDAFQVVKVEEPTPEQGRRILAKRTAELGRGLVLLDDEGLATLDRLHRRYAGYSAFPGRPLQFLRNLIFDVFSQHPDGFAEGPVTLGQAEVTAGFTRQSGLPPVLLDDEVRLDLPATQETFASRIIGQRDAVSLVAQVIATVKANLSRPRRPIASLLFIGPTGVGKTEMAKAIAEFFFSSADRMTRFDMSEYASVADVHRLVGGARGGEGLLTAKIREQPFSVVLLDEVEKAHPLLFDLLLQVLGEGRLTDAAGRLADFTNAIIVMTSNLGAESFQKGGFGLRDARTGGDAASHFTEEVRSFLRPELFNRIDRIVPFVPLDEATIEKIVRRELTLVARRDGILLRNVTFAPDDTVVRYLARKGYDRTYGARPLKRLIERELLVPLADGINGYGTDQALVVEVGVKDDALSVKVRSIGEAGGGPLTPANGLWATAAHEVADLRRRAQALQRATALLAVQNELFQLRRAKEIAATRARREKKVPPYDAAQEHRIGRLSQVADGAAAALHAANALEDRALEHVYGAGGSDADARQVQQERQSRTSDLDELLLNLYGLRYPDPDRVTLAIYGKAIQRVAELARAYVELAGGESAVKTRWFDRTDINVLVAEPPKANQDLLREPPAKAEGLFLSISTKHGLARFLGETGMHLFTWDSGNKQEECLVHVVDTPADQYQVPDEIATGETSPLLRLRRTYQLDRAMAVDAKTSGELRWGGTGYRLAMREAMAFATQAIIEEMVADGGSEA